MVVDGDDDVHDKLDAVVAYNSKITAVVVVAPYFDDSLLVEVVVAVVEVAFRNKSESYSSCMSDELLVPDYNDSVAFGPVEEEEEQRRHDDEDDVKVIDFVAYFSLNWDLSIVVGYWLALVAVA